ncbi:MAG TPA: glucose 1-dehydrogenase [Microvirga sp.]|jgi:glucose 1-dehydrogenase|nr:glucose 1-dehydrogenase [Microvirga sp.]
MTQGRLSGRFALVTGATRGIGRAIAERFAREGATVAINHRGEPGDALEAVRAAGSPALQHRLAQGDVSSPADIERMIDETVEAFGRLDIMVNNAGIQVEAPSETADPDTLEQILRVNLLGAAYGSQAAIRHFLSRPGGGVVLNNSSVHEIIPKPGFLAYSLSKGGMGNLTRTLALEYADRGIRVNAVGPGATLTDMNDAWRNDPKARAGVERHIPMRRAATAEEIAAVFAFLASDDASYVTGQTIYADGGLTLYGDFKENWAS